MAKHGDLGEIVAGLSVQSADALVFGTHYQSQWASQVGVVKFIFSVFRTTDNPNAVFFQLAQHFGNVANFDYRHMFRRSSGNGDSGVRQGGGPVFSNDDRMDACAICGPQASSQVVWILYPVQHQQQWLLLRLDQLKQKVFRLYDWSHRRRFAIGLVALTGSGSISRGRISFSWHAWKELELLLAVGANTK